MDHPLPPIPPEDHGSSPPRSLRQQAYSPVPAMGPPSDPQHIYQPPPRHTSLSQNNSPAQSYRPMPEQLADYPPHAPPRRSADFAQEYASQSPQRPASQANLMYNDASSEHSRRSRPRSEPFHDPRLMPMPAPQPEYPTPDARSNGYLQDPRQQPYPQYQPQNVDPDPFYTSAPIPRTPSPSYPQSLAQPRPPSPPLLDQSHLRPGKGVSLLSTDQTLALYRSNAKKTSDPDLIFEFAVFMLDASKAITVAPADANYSNQIEIEKAAEKQEGLVKEALGLLKRIADRGHVMAQYTLADCYANGIGTIKGKQDFEKAFPLFQLAGKHGHPDACYRAGTCCENGWGCRRESAKAVQWFKKAASAGHPGAQYRLGLAELNGELGLAKNSREGIKWLKRSAEHATEEFPHALHELAICHEKGIDNVIFVDYEYAAELLGQAADLGYAPSAYRLGECYEYGRMGCPMDPALSIHYYNIAAQQNHRDACFALTAWYLVGSPGVLPQSDTEAFLWAKRAADGGLVKAMYATGYFYETGVGTPPSMSDAMIYYKKAAEKGDKRAMQRLKGSNQGPITEQGGVPGVLRRDHDSGDNKKDCIIM